MELIRAVVSSMRVPLLVLLAAGLAAPSLPAQSGKKSGSEKTKSSKKDSESKDGKDSQEPSTTPVEGKAPSGPDVDYVKSHLKEYVHGTVVFDEAGNVSIEYELMMKKEEFQNDFRPPISPKVPAPFRWSNHEEDTSIGSDPGVRISDKGAAFFIPWFADDVEASMVFLNGISWSKQQVCAIVFQNKGGQAIGCNYGSQAATFSNGGFQGGAPPTEALAFNVKGTFGLKVKGGFYDVLKNGKSKKTAKYNQKSYASGKIGFIWGGKVAGTLLSFTVKGKLDYAATAKEMKKVLETK